MKRKEFEYQSSTFFIRRNDSGGYTLSFSDGISEDDFGEYETFAAAVVDMREAIIGETQVQLEAVLEEYDDIPD